MLRRQQLDGWLPICSNASSAKFFEGQDSDRYIRYLLLVCPAAFLAVGLPGDAVSAVLWCRRVREAPGSTALFLATLCSVDTLVLLQGCCRHLAMTVGCLDLRLLLGCRAPLFLYTWLSTLSVWIICLMCCERLVCVLRPFRMKVICRRRNGAAALCCTAAALAACNAYLLLIVDPRSCDAKPQFRHLRRLFNTVDSVVYSYLPFALIVCLNAAIVARLGQQRRRSLAAASLRRRQRASGDSRRRRGPSGAGSSQRILATVLCMAACHLLLTAPIVLWHLRLAELCDFGRRAALCMRIEFTCQILEKLNHLTHFFIFSFTSSVFVSDFKSCAAAAVGCLGNRRREQQLQLEAGADQPLRRR